MILPEAGDLLTPAMAIDGFRLGCLIDGPPAWSLRQ